MLITSLHSSCQSFITSFGRCLIPTDMSGFSTRDFRAATKLATNALALLAENEANQDSVIILSFRSLQAQRIKESQEELLQISIYKVKHLNSAAPGSSAAVNHEARLDGLLNNYG